MGANPGLECTVLSGHRKNNGEVSHPLLELYIPYPHLLGVPWPVVGLGLPIISPFIGETLHLNQGLFRSGTNTSG